MATPTEHGSEVDWVDKTCPYCQFPLKLADEVCACDGCGIHHHVECWEQNGGCTTFGCTGGRQGAEAELTARAAPASVQVVVPGVRPDVLDLTPVGDLSMCLACGALIPEGDKCLVCESRPRVKKLSETTGITAVLIVIAVVMCIVVGVQMKNARDTNPTPAPTSPPYMTTATTAGPSTLTTQGGQPADPEATDAAYGSLLLADTSSASGAQAYLLEALADLLINQPWSTAKRAALSEACLATYRLRQKWAAKPPPVKMQILYGYMTDYLADATDGADFFKGELDSGRLLTLDEMKPFQEFCRLATAHLDQMADEAARLKLTTTPGAYALGSTGPAGGLVFYDKGTTTDGWRYLEAAPASTEWSAPWGANGTDINGAYGIAIGTGKQNTADIVAIQGTGSTYAAQLCDALTYGGYDDWFLPSKDELNLMYTNLKSRAFGGFQLGNYWSSSEDGLPFYAFSQSFVDGVQFFDYYKDVTSRVRAARAF